MADEKFTVEDILADPLPENVHPQYVTAIVVLVEWFDEESGESLLGWTRNTDVGIWRHLGMVESASGDFRGDLRKRDHD